MPVAAVSCISRARAGYPVEPWSGSRHLAFQLGSASGFHARPGLSTDLGVKSPFFAWQAVDAARRRGVASLLAPPVASCSCARPG